MSMEKKKNEKGFILPLALLMMLFVGVVVITSSERTSQETRQAQSQAPTATLQAAAEAGLLTLRQKINEAGTSTGICKDEAGAAEDSVKKFCDCIGEKSLDDLMEGDGGYPGNEMSFSTQSGGEGVSWWFEKNNQEEYFVTCFEDEKGTDPRCDDEDLEDSNTCRVVANVFAGDPATKPGYFMRGTIDIQENSFEFGTPEYTSKVLNDLLDKLKDGFDLSEDELNSLIDAFFDSELDLVGNDAVNVLSFASGSQQLDESHLSSSGVNLVVLKDGANVDFGGKDLSDKTAIVISKSSSQISFSTKGNKKALGGLIVAPNSTVELESGANKVPFSAIYSGCYAGSSAKSCEFEGNMSGGAKLMGYDLSDLQSELDDNSSDSDDESSGDSKVDVQSSEEMNMDFDY